MLKIKVDLQKDNSPFLGCWSVYCISVYVAEEHHSLIVLRGLKQPVFMLAAASKWRWRQKRKSGDVCRMKVEKHGVHTYVRN